MRTSKKYYFVNNEKIIEASEIEAYTKIDDKKCLKGYSGTINKEDGLFMDISLNFLSSPVLKYSEKFFFEIYGSLILTKEKLSHGPLRFGMYRTRDEASEAFDFFLKKPMSLFVN